MEITPDISLNYLKVVKEVLHRVFAPVNIEAHCFAIRTDSHETKPTRRVNFCFGCAAS